MQGTRYIDSVNGSGLSALHLAAVHGSADTVRPPTWRSLHWCFPLNIADSVAEVASLYLLTTEQHT